MSTYEIGGDALLDVGEEADVSAFCLAVQVASPWPLNTRVPVTVGVPLPRGQNWPVKHVTLYDPHRDASLAGQLLPEIRRDWMAVAFMTPTEFDASGCELFLHASADPAMPAALQEEVVVRQSQDRVVAHTGAADVEVRGTGARLVEQILVGDAPALGEDGIQVQLTTRWGNRRTFEFGAIEVAESGPIRATLVRHAKCAGLRLTCRLSLFAGTGLVRCELILHNPRRAKHSGGYWDLGDPGSILFRGLSLDVHAAVAGAHRTLWQANPKEPLEHTVGNVLEIFQESSGGENWRSRNHVNRNGEVPLRFRGYRIRTAETQSHGNRANPVAALTWQRVGIACAVEDFWQKFPTAITIEKNRLSAKVFPDQCGDLHELQAGEKCSRVVWLDFHRPEAEAWNRLSWVYDPPQAIVDPSWHASSGRLSRFPLADVRHRTECESLLHEAIDGPRSFFTKREVIDEFGWRNFGDVWADHEEAYSDDPRPVISHYNNQYDLLYGLLIQYLHTGDTRWWRLADPLARHVMDIDVYHTTRDKPAYNGGLFWHTAHYHSAGKCTHRSMSHTMRGKKIAAPGTGPANEHNYSRGLLLYACLTGSCRARDTVIGLAEWVLAMDEGRRHLLGVVSDEPTGDASRTTQSTYHGPGRGAANSMNTLLDAWSLTVDEKYLRKARELLRRTIHPHDDIDGRRLGDAELRWSYTVHLQAIIHFLGATVRRSDLKADRAYARDALLHYARWMCKHERFYLDEPEKLEYPTETWAAQELRKGNSLLMAAQFASSDEVEDFQARGRAILDEAWRRLQSFESRTSTRAIAIILQQGYLETYFRSQPGGIVQAGEVKGEYSPPIKFVSQKEHVRSAIHSPVELLKLLARAMSPGRWMNAFAQTWFAERVRRLVDT